MDTQDTLALVPSSSSGTVPREFTSLNYIRVPFSTFPNSDTTLYPQNFWEDIKQWTNVFGVSATPASNLTNNPQAGYSRASFGPNVQAILAQGVGHTVPEHATDVLDWFGISNVMPGSGAGNAPPASSAPASTPSQPPATGGSNAQWAQCGGIGFIGPTGA